jgi:hypothetical protein
MGNNEGGNGSQEDQGVRICNATLCAMRRVQDPLLAQKLHCDDPTTAQTIDGVAVRVGVMRVQTNCLPYQAI